MKAHFDKLKENLELSPTFQSEVSTRHNAIRSAIENISGKIEGTKLIGSLQRKTRIQPRTDDEFDIDILVILGTFDRWVPTGGITPAAAQAHLLQTLQSSDRYNKYQPCADAPTVTLQFDKIKVELVPAYRDSVGRSPSGASTLPAGRGYWVPTQTGWEFADYDFDASEVTRLNALADGRLVPTIKILKAIKRHRFPQLKSFGLEILACQTIPMIVQYRAERNMAAHTDAELLEYFFDLTRNAFSAPLSLPGSNSPPIAVSPFDALALGAAFSRIANEIRAIESTREQRAKVDGWRGLFGDCFPKLVWI